jgi:hypothetical protein
MGNWGVIHWLAMVFVVREDLRFLIPFLRVSTAHCRPMRERKREREGGREKAMNNTPINNIAALFIAFTTGKWRTLAAISHQCFCYQEDSS